MLKLILCLIIMALGICYAICSALAFFHTSDKKTLSVQIMFIVQAVIDFAFAYFLLK